MTEEEHIKLVEIGNEFWIKFSDLCNFALEECVRHGIDRDEASYYLADKTSFFGRRQE